MEINNSTTPRELKKELNSTAQNVKGQAQEAISEFSESWKDGFEHAYGMIQDRTRQATDVSESFIKKHPLTTVLGAAAVGLLAGILLARRD